VDPGGLADKAKNALDSEQGEQRSDQALDKADQQTDKVGDLADQRVGQQDAGQSGSEEPRRAGVRAALRPPRGGRCVRPTDVPPPC